MKEENWLQTFSGKRFYPRRPEITEIKIEDIAVGISNMCRFSGQIPNFYSVSQHSVFVSRIIKDAGGTTEAHQFAGLMHDASEAYMVDIPTPLKELLPEYKRLEKIVQSQIEKHFGVQCTEDTKKLVKWADKVALATEAFNFFGGVPWESIRGIEPRTDIFEIPVDPQTARHQFMDLFGSLFNYQNVGRTLC